MIAKFFGAIGVPVWAVWALLALAIALGIGVWGQTKYRAGHAAGEIAERLVWTNAMNDLRDEMDEERAAAQQEIRNAQRTYAASRIEAWAARQALEKARREKSDDQDRENAGDTGGAGRVFIRRNVSNALNQIGR
ncbi:MAG: hypothetical protein KDJ90_00770 [Nitratireductor sp.]|nr:hypothetical protein [Nitratireductor sp.]